MRRRYGASPLHLLAPLTLLASRALHEAETRAFRPEFDAIFRGTARLVW